MMVVNINCGSCFIPDIAIFSFNDLNLCLIQPVAIPDLYNHYKYSLKCTIEQISKVSVAFYVLNILLAFENKNKILILDTRIIYWNSIIRKLFIRLRILHHRFNVFKAGMYISLHILY